MSRHWFVVALVMHAACSRLAAQDTRSDTLTDSLRRRLRLEGAWLRRLPIDDPRHALVLIPGVRLTGADVGITPVTTLMIRGSAAGRSNVYVDGAPLRFETRGGAGVELAPNAIDTLSLMTGVAPATLSDAGGGVISYQTRSGGQRLAGDVRWDSDEPFSDATTVGFNRLAGTIGGPLAASGRLTFFVSTTLQGQASSYRGLNASAIPAFLPAGLDTTVNSGGTPVAVSLLENEASGLRRPLDWSTARHAHAKLAYQYGASSRASLTLIGGDLQQRFFPGQLAMRPALYTGRRMWSGAVILNWQHGLGAWRSRPLAFDVNLSILQHRDMSGPLDSTVELGTRDPPLGLAFRRLRFFGAEVVGLPTDASLIRDLRTNSGTRGVPFFGLLPDATQRGPINPYGVSFGWPTDGFGGTLSDVAERRVQGRWVLNWNRSRGGRVGVGMDWERGRISSYSSDILRQLGTDAVLSTPSRLGVFTDNHFAISEALIDLGLRYDRITPGGDLPVVPAFIAASGPALWNPNAATDDTAYTSSVARVFRRARTQSVFSPRIAFSYPIAAKTALRLGYSRTVEPLSWGSFFSHSNSDLSFTDVRELFGRDIDFAVVGLIEGGVRFALGPADLDIGVYRKNLPMYVGRLTPVNDPRDTTRTVTVNVLSVLDDSHAQGVDVGLGWQRGWLTASGAYSLSHITSPPASLTTPNRAPVTMHSAAITASVQIPNDWKEGTFLGSVARGTNIVLLARVQSGESYTRLQNNGFGTIAPGGGLTSGPIEPFNASRLPWFKRLDLRIAKTVRARGHDWSLYVDARNLLNFSNLVALFAETGDTANALHRDQTLGDPTFNTGEYRRLRIEASDAGALRPDGTTVDLGGCAAWPSPVNCVALTRVERRFGNGDQVFTLTEQQRAFEAYYRDFLGAWRLYAPGRTIRIGMELQL